MRNFLAVLLIFALSACDDDPVQKTETTFSGSTMGTTFHVKVVDLPESQSAERVGEQLKAILKDINDKMSLWVKNSELVRFNQNPSLNWQDVSADLLHVVEEANKISILTNGRFDVSIEPLIKLWGFSTKSMTGDKPSEQEIEDALKKVGYQKISIRPHPPALKKSHSETTINLSSIAKGYGIDQLATYLESLGVNNYMVEIGGDLRVKGTNARTQPWRIAIEKPDAAGRSVHRIVNVTDAGMATSGDYRNFFEKDGKRFTHIIDPQTGYPITHRLASVTVISNDAMTADGLATALLALGDIDGPKLAENNGIAAFFLIRTHEGFVEIRTTHFDALQSTSDKNLN